MIQQLNPQIPVIVLREKGDRKDAPQGSGQCIAWMDYGPEHDLMWLVLMDNGGEPWLVPNWRIRGMKNYTLNRKIK